MNELRESLEKNWEDAEKAGELENDELTPEPQPEPEPAPESEPEPEQDDEEGKDAEPAPAKSEEKKKPSTPDPKLSRTEKDPAPKGEADADKTRLGKAPGGWTPRAREVWKNVPEAARAEILKRETEIAQAMQQSAQARQAVTRLNQVLTPYRNGLMAAGVNDPFQAIDVLFKTEAQLRSGNVVEKAHTVANLIKQYGVDISALDEILAGQQPSNPQHNQLEQMIEQRLAPVNQFLQHQATLAQQTEYQQQAEANQSVSEFAQNAEFLEDVRMEMADILDVAASHGRKMTLKQAYDIACNANEEVRAIMAAREKEKSLMGNQQSIAAKRHAAASLTGKKGGEGGNQPANSLRDAISLAWEEATG